MNKRTILLLMMSSLALCGCDSAISNSTALSSSESSSAAVSSSSSSSKTSSSSKSSSSSSSSSSIANVIQFSELPTSKSEVTYFDISNETFDPNKPIPVLVTLVEFTDGYVVDHDEFEKRFSDDTLAPEDSLKSVASYYKYNSYGKVRFDFRFLYYSSPMSSNEAWHYVNDEDEMGHFRGNQFFFDVLLK